MLRFLSVCPAVLISGGHQTGLSQHLQDHGLCGLLQVSTVGETAGEGFCRSQI